MYQCLHWQQNGYQTDFENLRESGLEKVSQGITDEKEIERVLGKNL